MHRRISLFYTRAFVVLSILGLGLLTACGQQPSDSGKKPEPTTTNPTTNSTPASNATSVSVSPEQGKFLDKNLIVNGDAEAGPGGTPEQPVVGDVPGWTRGGTMTVLKYVEGETVGGVGSTDPRPDDHGNNYFAGGPAAGSHALATATQTIDISTLASVVDTGKLNYTLSGYLGGWGSYSNQAEVSVQFLGADQHDLGNLARIGPVQAGNNGQSKEATGLWKHDASKTVPVGTRFLKVTLTISVAADTPEAANNSSNTGFADSLSFVLKYA